MPDPFVIAPLPVGQGTLALCPLPGRLGDFPGDMAQILRFAPDLILSLTQDAERSALGAATLPDQITWAGIVWHPFPIPDFGIPPADADWSAAANAATKILAKGGRVLVHCRGGLGRSGMVALRLMIEHGEAPDDALTRLRAVRPGAVETAAQHRWARSPARSHP